MKNPFLTILHYIYSHIMCIINAKEMYKNSISQYFVSKSVMISPHESINPSVRGSCIELRFHVSQTPLK